MEFGQAFAAAFRLITTLDAGLVEIVGLSLRVSLSAVGLAALVGLPLGAAVALYRFPGRLVIAALLNAGAGHRQIARSLGCAPSTVTRTPPVVGSSAVRRTNLDTAAIDGRASPRKPRVPMCWRSSADPILEVA